MLRTMLISLSSVIAIGAVTSSAFAGCNLDGDLIVAYQSNGPVSYFTNIRQRGDEIQGGAKYGTMRGDFSGLLEENGRLAYTVTWDDGVRGNYTGFVTPDGRVLDGVTYQVGNKSNAATHYAST